MKFLRFPALLVCALLTMTAAFAAGATQLTLSGGTFVGNPSTIYMDTTNKKICDAITPDGLCKTQIYALLQIPADNTTPYLATPYLGSTIKGLTLIYNDGIFSTSDSLFKTGETSVKNLFASGQFIAVTLSVDGSAFNTIQYDPAKGWLDFNGKGISKLPALPAKTGYKFIGFWAPDLMIIDGSGNILNVAKSLSGAVSAFAKWELDTSLITCNAGQFLANNSSYCSTCPVNTWCPGGTFTQSNQVQGLNYCDSGLISLQGSSSIEDCVTPQTVNCTAGQFLPGGSTCQVCPDYHWCPGGTYTESYQQAQGINWCGGGLYSSSGSDSAEDCYELGAEDVICPAGKFLPANMMTCISCQENYWCPGGAFTQSNQVQGLNYCDSGLISLQGSSSIEDCVTAQSVATCAKGEFLPNDSLICETCMFNHWCPGGTFTYNSQSNQGNKWCGEGLMTSNTGSTVIEDCIGTITCAGGQYLPKNSVDWQWCPGDSWCPGGNYSTSSSIDQWVYGCPSGQTSASGSDSADDCIKSETILCNPGNFLKAGATSCSSCLANNWCPGGDFYQSDYEQGLNKCPEGTVCNFGQMEESSCHTPTTITCSAGNYLYYGKCEKCPKDTWCPGGDFTETYTSTEGLNKCSSGETSPEGSDSADDCIKSETILCNPGNFLKAGATSCSLCSPNNWCPGGSFSEAGYDQGLNNCPAGTVCNFGQMEESSCHTPTTITCSAGNYLYYGKCEKCPKDTWCPGGDFTETYTSTEGLNKCSSGETSPEGSDSADDCKSGSSAITCNPGEFLRMNSSICESCTPNFWCPGGAFYPNIYDQGRNTCKDGLISIGGSNEEKACHTPTTITCSAGNYMNYGKCEKCPKDTWCPGGDFTETYTSTEGLNKCSSGETSPEGSDSADDCKSGSSAITCNPGEFLRMNSSICESCTPNFWCPGGAFYPNIYDQGRNTCKDGLISIGGSNEEKACHVPATLTCAAGTYMNYGGCVNCLKNNWCPGGNFLESYTTKLGINNCPNGETSPEGSDEELDCTTAQTLTCAPGTYLPAGATECYSCNIGSWCPGGEFAVSTDKDQGVNGCPIEGSSPNNSDAITDCYKDHLPTAIPNGSGMQMCYYGTVGYTNCKLNYVTSCDGGYYTENSAENSSAGKGYNTGCIVVGYNYYSPQGAFCRNACPGTKNGLKGETETETSSDINQCSITTIYTTGSGDVINGVGHTICSYSETTKGYGIAEITNRDPLILPKGPITDPLCSSNQKIVFCFGGYFLENDSGLECGPVGDGYYSPRPNYNEMTGCLTDDESNCTYQVDIDDYQSARGRETCPATYPHSELPRTSLKKCYKDCTLDVLNSVSVTPITSKIYYASGGKGEPEPVCKFNVECNTGYKAVDNGTEKPSCELDGSVCQNDPNAVESDANCIPTKCKDTYHLENKKCIENVVSCPIENGLGRKEWMKDNILGGKWTMCTAYQCNPGYTSERYLTNETSKPCGECKNRRDASGNIVVSAWKETNCEIATCMYQGELYRYDNNKCVQICDTAGREDITGKMIWDPLSEKCDRSCNPGFTNW